MTGIEVALAAGIVIPLIAIVIKLFVPGKKNNPNGKLDIIIQKLDAVLLRLAEMKGRDEADA